MCADKTVEIIIGVKKGRVNKHLVKKMDQNCPFLVLKTVI